MEEASRTVGDALAEYRRSNGLDGRDDSAPSWTCRLGPVTLRLPNFSWRRHAIVRHDLHHVMTGYPCTMRGEFQMAAWEFAAGRYPHMAATLFCLPLVAAGLVWSPRAIWRAFLSGRKGRSLYGRQSMQTLLALPVRSLHCRPSTNRSTRRDVLAFAVLVFQALVTVIGPCLALGVAFAAL